MFKTYYLILLLGHILGDFYFQTEKMARLKNREISKLFAHCIIYALIQTIIVFAVFSNDFLIPLIFVCASHFIIDLVKFIFVKYIYVYNDVSEKVQYITDQTLHLVCVGVGAYMLIDKSVLSYFFIDIFNAVELSPDSFIKMLVLILFMNKPANITIKKFIEWYKPYENSVVVNNKKSGAFIGTLERYIILILLFVNQYSAIGFVLTAKSIARYHEMENKDFAEYYLMGTLLSTFIVIVSYLIIM